MSILSLILLASMGLLAILSRVQQRPSRYRINDADELLKDLQNRKNGVKADAQASARVPGDFIPASDTILGPGSGFLGGAVGGKLSGIAYLGSARASEYEFGAADQPGTHQH